MSNRELFAQNGYNLFCKDLTLSGDLNMDGDLHLDDVHVTSTTDSTNTATGALVVDGGVGIAKRLNVGDSILTYGSLILSQSNNGGTGFSLSGDQIFVRNDRNINQFNIPFTTTASSSTTGALIVGGGVGVVGDLYVGGAIHSNSSIGSSTTINTTLSGPWASALTSNTVTCTKVGNIVNIQYPVGLTGTVTSSQYNWSFPTPLPSGYYNTSHAVNCPIEITNNNADIMASVRMSVDGTWGVTAPVLLTGTAGTSIGGFSITFSV